MRRHRFLVATADDDARVGLRRHLDDPDAEFRTASTGVDCIELLRTFEPDILILVPPLLWGSEDGVLELIQTNPAFHRITTVVLAETGETRFLPTGFGSSTGFDGDPARLDRVLARLCEWSGLYRRSRELSFPRLRLSPPVVFRHPRVRPQV
jgi:hypothetical protein